MTGEHLLSERATITDRVPTRDVDDNLVRDGYGNVITAPVVRELVPAWHQQTARGENLAGQDVRDETWDLFLAAGDPLSATSKVTIGGVDYEVVGEPWQTVNPRTRERGLVQATIRRTAG